MMVYTQQKAAAADTARGGSGKSNDSASDSAGRERPYPATARSSFEERESPADRVRRFGWDEV